MRPRVIHANNGSRENVGLWRPMVGAKRGIGIAAEYFGNSPACTANRKARSTDDCGRRDRVQPILQLLTGKNWDR